MTGRNLNETTLTHANVNTAQFGKKFSVSTDGRVEGQPLYVAGVTIGNVQHNVMYLVTEHDSIYAFDADTGTQLWKTSALKPGESTAPVDSCSQNEVEIGITQTPIIDLSVGPHGTIYAVAKSVGGGTHQRLHALDISTGAEEFGGPVDIHANFGSKSFDPVQYKERTSLVILNGVVYTTWASWDCDKPPYSAWLIGYNTQTLTQQGVFNFTPNGSKGAMWGGGAGPATDSQGNMYILLANGTFDTTLNANGFPNNGDFGNAIVKFAVSGGISVKDYWTMSNTVAESNGDVDLGSGANIVIPDDFTDANGVVRHLGAGAGKDRNIYVFDRDNMGHFNPNNNSGLYQQLSGALAGKALGIPAYFNGIIYFGAAADKIKAYTITNARLSSTPTATTPNSFNYPGVNPAISANGTSDPILWATNWSGTGNNGNGVLHAYDANNIGIELWNSGQAPNNRDKAGATTKRNAPTVADGKVMVATATGATVYGLLGGGCADVPATPTGVSATAASSSTINLSWTASTAPSGCMVTYTVTRNAAQAATGLSGTTFSDTGRTCNTTYSYTVTAVDAAGSSAASSPASATTLACTPTPTATVTPTTTPTPTPIVGGVRINSGGPAVSPFVADMDFVGGTAATNWTGAIDTTGVANPAPQAVYQSERYGASTYTVPGFAAGSSHTVRLHMCENFFTATGKRVFNVSINGTTVLTNFDIFAAAGAIHKATIREFTVGANASGQYVIQLSNVTNNALVNGIEVTDTTATPTATSTPSPSPSPTATSATSTPTATVPPTPTATPTPTLPPSVRINSGGGAVSPFVADMNFVGGTAATNWTGAIDTSAVTNPAPQGVYQPERYGASTYTIPGFAAGSSHTVRLHMCENYFTATGKRVFSVSINGVGVLTNFDIFAATGAAHKATVREFTTAANASGQYVIQFSNVTNNALINGIEIN